MNAQALTQPITTGDGWAGRILTHAPSSYADLESVTLPSADHWRNFFDRLRSDPRSLPNYRVLKHSPIGQIIRTTFELDSGALDVVAKQSLNRGLRRQLSGLFRPSRSRRNFKRGLTLMRAGLHTAMPLAFFARKGLDLAGESWLVTHFVPDLVDLDDVMLRRLATLPQGRTHRVKSALVEAVADLLTHLEAHDLTHRDFKASNVLMRSWNGDGGPPSVWLIDLDGLYRLGSRATARRWRPIIRLAASLLGYTGATRTDLVRLLRAQTRRAGASSHDNASRQECRSAFELIAAAAARYSTDAQARKLNKLEGYANNG